MPTPKPKETRDDYMGRCIPMLVNEGKPEDQAVAICGSMFDEAKRKEKSEQEEASKNAPIHQAITGKPAKI